jgi:ribosomal protein L9
MSASRVTPNFLLPLFDAEDKPSWLGDWNNTMAKIEAALNAKEAEINALTAQLNTQTARITALASATGHVGI